ncbi:MAG: uroporphyrinogen-III synthase, partial [Terracidiphilus sp.]
TRAAHQAGKLSAGLRALGAEPVEVPLLEIQPPRSLAPLDRALRNLAGYDWLLFTSANTVRAVAARARELGISLDQYRRSPDRLSGGSPDPRQGDVDVSSGPASPATNGPPDRNVLTARIAAVGTATADALAKEGMTVALVPQRYVAEGLIEALSAQESLAGRRILLARAQVARDLIPDALSSAGARVDVVEAYRNALPANATVLLRAALSQPIHAALFTSSSTAEHLAEAARRAGMQFPLPGVLAVSIGPITSQTLREHGWPPAGEANPHDIPGLLEALTRALR